MMMSGVQLCRLSLPAPLAAPRMGRSCSRFVPTTTHIIPPSSRLPRRTRFSTQDKGAASEEDDAARRSGDQDDEEERTAIAAEIKDRLAAMKNKEEDPSSSSEDLWGGVLAEVREIEWPPFGKVLPTTGIVLAVIAGSSVALLTVNAILAEISDRVFAGRGLQDFF